MAKFKTGYQANGVLTTANLELTETHAKKGILTHDLAYALGKFEGQDITISISVKEEVAPKEVG